MVDPFDVRGARAETDLGECGRLLSGACIEIERLRAEREKLIAAVRAADEYVRLVTVADYYDPGRCKLDAWTVSRDAVAEIVWPSVEDRQE